MHLVAVLVPGSQPRNFSIHPHIMLDIRQYLRYIWYMWHFRRWLLV